MAMSESAMAGGRHASTPRGSPARAIFSVDPADDRSDRQVVRAAPFGVRRDDRRIEDGAAGRPKAAAHMQAAGLRLTPAGGRDQGVSAKRSTPPVWANGSPKIPALIREGKAPNVAVNF